MAEYHIKGGKKLSGRIDATAGKNAPIALLLAALMVKGQVVLNNLTEVEEVGRILEILESIGVKFQLNGQGQIRLDTSGQIDITKINRLACEETRASLLLFGALAARVKNYRLYKSGGCKLGARTIRPHTLALQKLGVVILSREKYYEVKTQTLAGTKVVMYESGDTPTENVIMAAVLAPGTTTISFASANYMVQELCYFLHAAGAKISGIGTTTLVIEGVKSLRPKVAYSITPDPVDAMAWISLAIATKSRLVIGRCPLPFLDLELEKLRVMGQKFIIRREYLSDNGQIPLVDIECVPGKLHALPDKLYGRPFPGLNIDNVPLFLPILTQARGRTLVHDWCYENRAVYYLELKKLGANVLLLDSHRALVEGPTPLIGNEIVCPPALRPAMAILIGMLAAKGDSILRDCYTLERGYDRLVERLSAVGAKITRI